MSLICISLIVRDIEHLSKSLLTNLYVFFGEIFIQVFCPFFDQVVCLILICKSYSYILEINLSVSLFPNILPHSTGCLFAHSFLCYSEAFNQFPVVYFCFYFHYSRRWVIGESCCCISFLDKCLFRSSAHFKSGVICFLELSFIEPGSPTLQADALPSEPPRNQNAAHKVLFCPCLFWLFFF